MWSCPLAGKVLTRVNGGPIYNCARTSVYQIIPNKCIHQVLGGNWGVTRIRAGGQQSATVTVHSGPRVGPASWAMFGLISGGLEVKVPASNVGDLGSIPGSGRSPGEGNGNPFQCSCLENPMDGGAWKAAVHGVAKSRT